MLRTLACIALLLAIPPWAAAQPDDRAERKVVEATGQAPADLPNAYEAAVEDALRRCVEAGGGLEQASVSRTQDFVLISDVIYTKTVGYIEQREILARNPNQDGLYTVRVRAVVKRGNICADVEAFKALLKRKGRPRLIVVGAADKRPFEPRLTAELESTLVKHGLTAIDLRRLSENQRRDAERAARGELDPAKAALIVREVGADYLVIVGVEGTIQPPQTAYGQTLYPIDGTGMLKVVRADTAMILASEVVKGHLTASTQQRALEEMTTRVTQDALKLAIRRVASNWLEDVDQRGGQEIVIVFERLAGDRLGNLIAALRKVQGARDVIVDSTDAEGRSQLRVVTNSSAADVGFTLQKIDPALVLKESSKYRVVFAAANAPGPVGVEIRIYIIVAIGIAALAAIVVVLVLRHRP